MKTPFLTAVILMMSLFAIGQTSNSPIVVTINHEYKTITNMDALNSLNKGDWYQLEVYRVNSLLWDVEVNHPD